MQDVIRDPSLYKLPPHSIEAEESIICAMLLNNKAIEDVFEIVEPTDFYRTSHQTIAENIKALNIKKEPVDLVTVTNSLRKNGKLEQVGGATYLSKLITEVPISTSVKNHAGIIRDNAAKRELIEKANNIIGVCYENSDTAENILGDAQKNILNIEYDYGSKQGEFIGSLLPDFMDHLESIQGKGITGIPSGYSLLDKFLCGFQGGDLILIAARPAMGKTSLALNIARNVVVDGETAVVFTLEMSKQQLVKRAITSETRINGDRLKGGYLSNDDWTRITAAADFLSDKRMIIDEVNRKIKNIMSAARKYKKEHNIGLVIIDYIQLAENIEHYSKREEEVSAMARGLKLLALELNIPIIALAQLNRMLEQRSDKRPILSDLRESGALEQDADVVLFVYRDEMYNKKDDNPNKGKAEIIIAKHRDGPTGTVLLAFLGACVRFENLAPASTYDFEPHDPSKDVHHELER